MEYILKPEVKCILEDKLKTVHGVQCLLNSDSTECISEGLGAICRVWQIKVEWKCRTECDEPDLPKTILIKVPRLSDTSELVSKMQDVTEVSEQRGVEMSKMFHDNEVEVYEMFESAGDVHVPRPTCYYAGKMDSPFGGIIVLEDLTAKATLIDDISCGMSFNQIFNVCSSLADFHSWCLTTTVEWRNRFPPLFPISEMVDWLSAMVTGGIALLKTRFPGRFDSVDDKLVLTYMKNKWPIIVDKLAVDLPEVLRHGDLWTNNILFKRNTDGTAGDELIALIDWQLCAKGSPIEDVCKLLVWSTSASFRRQHQRAIVQSYHDRLSNNLAGKMPIPDFQLFWSSYEAIFPQVAFQLICFFHALVGTVIKCRGVNNEQRLEVMLHRVFCAYHEALEYI